MNLILDSTILIAGERRGETVRDIVQRVQQAYGNVEAGLSTVSLIELTHGIYRARNDLQRDLRRQFVEELSRDLFLYPLTSEIAQLAGRIEGEQATQGIIIPFQDLIIGATALHLGFGVATLNLRHFRLIPELSVVSL